MSVLVKLSQVGSFCGERSDQKFGFELVKSKQIIELALVHLSLKSRERSIVEVLFWSCEPIGSSSLSCELD